MKRRKGSKSPPNKNTRKRHPKGSKSGSHKSESAGTSNRHEWNDADPNKSTMRLLEEWGAYYENKGHLVGKDWNAITHKLGIPYEKCSRRLQLVKTWATSKCATDHVNHKHEIAKYNAVVAKWKNKLQDQGPSRDKKLMDELPHGRIVEFLIKWQGPYVRNGSLSDKEWEMIATELQVTPETCKATIEEVIKWEASVTRAEFSEHNVEILLYRRIRNERQSNLREHRLSRNSEDEEGRLPVKRDIEWFVPNISFPDDFGQLDNWASMMPGEEVPFPEFTEEDLADFLGDIDRGDLIPDSNLQVQPPKQINHSAGLVNIENTRYMNGALQCLHAITELGEALNIYGNQNLSDPSTELILALRKLFISLQTSSTPVTPREFWMALRKRYPQFSEMQDGLCRQQDADECLTNLITLLCSSSGLPSNVKDLFDLGLTGRVFCSASGEESTVHESQPYLQCFVSGDVNNFQEGIRRAMVTTNELHTIESRIAVLPRYLIVRFQRMSYDEGFSNGEKNLKRVDFPMEWDVTEFCSSELCQGAEGTVPKYELVALLSHQGRTLNSGHNMAFVKKQDQWIKYDDAEVAPVPEEEVKALSGGRDDKQIAYLCFYKAKDVPK